MGTETRLSSYCTKRGEKAVNLVTSRKTNARLARPIEHCKLVRVLVHNQDCYPFCNPDNVFSV